MSLLYQYWIHTCLIPPLPRFELLFNSAHLHRAHHARNAPYLSCNFGAVLSIWDRLGGTFRSPPENGDDDDDDTLRYGVVPPLHTFSPLWANITHFHHVATRQLRWHGVRGLFQKWTPQPNKRYPKFGSKCNPIEKYESLATRDADVYYGLTQWMIGLSLGVAVLEIPSLAAAAPSALGGGTLGTALGGLLSFFIMLGFLEGAGRVLDEGLDATLARREAARHVATCGVVVALALAAGSRSGLSGAVYGAGGIAFVSTLCHVLWLVGLDATRPKRMPPAEGKRLEPRAYRSWYAAPK